jgi:hypothetical protein
MGLSKTLPPDGRLNAQKPAVRHVDPGPHGTAVVLSECKHVADDEHPVHEHRINRGMTNLGSEAVGRSTNMFSIAR